MSDKLSDCAECGMPCASGEYHPHAACLMFKCCHDSTTVRAGLAAIREHALSASHAPAIPAELRGLLVECRENLDSLGHAGIRERLTAQIDAIDAAPAISESEDAPWVRVEDRMPEAQRTVIATYLNQYGKRRRIRAQYIPANTRESNGDDGDLECLYDEATDTFYWPAGWYECIDNWGDYTHVFVGDGQVTHWTDMPEAPVDAARDGGGS